MLKKKCLCRQNMQQCPLKEQLIGWLLEYILKVIVKALCVLSLFPFLAKFPSLDFVHPI